MAREGTVAGRYRIESRLGSGGMSTVHLAFDQRLERYVAVKLLAEHLASDPAFVSRFQREALAAARLIHPNIVQVFDSGLDERRDQHYIVMEYIDGQSCAEMLRERGWLPVEEAMPIILGSCAGLDYAHRKGVVHRDVKPGNLLVATDHSVKLADFGIAKATEQSSITQIGSVLGTAAYLAPEQGRGEEAGPPADIYALGVVAYQLISGRLPFEGASLTELAIKQQREPPPALDTLVAAVTPELARAVDIALRIDPRHRYPTAAEMARGLDEGARGIAPGSGTAVVPPMGPAATTVLSAGEPRTRIATPGGGAQTVTPRQPRAGQPRAGPPRREHEEERPGPKPRTGRIAAALGALALVIIVIVVVLLTNQGSSGVQLQHGSFLTSFDGVFRQLSTLIQENSP
jgi:serine/threonine-protein kinase